MTRQFTKEIFASTYKDDFADSDNFHRILFNGGRSLQARELTQLQTITQKEISRLGRHLFKDGAAVNPGGVTCDNKIEFVKLNTSINAFPTNTASLASLVGTQLTTSEGIIVEVSDYVAATAVDPATIYINYINTAAGVDNTAPVRCLPGTTLTGGEFTFTVQSTNTTTNPAVGQGTKVSIHAGDFFAENRFVYSPQQTKIISKYTNNPSTVVGFKSEESIVTALDDDRLYDNAGAVPNRSAPGADRYRIRLVMTEQSDLDSADNFIYVANIVNGAIQSQVQATDNYNAIEDRLALRTKEESGDYIAQPFTLEFATDLIDDSIINFNVGRGIAYVSGYRVYVNAPKQIPVTKPRSTVSLNNEVIAADYGNYLTVSSENNAGLPDINSFELVNLRNAFNYGGATIGTARVLAVEEDFGSYYRVYFFNLVMNSGQDKRNIKSFGTSVSNYMNPQLEGGKAAWKDTANTTLLFKLPAGRPQSVSDISLSVLRRATVALDANGDGALPTLSAAGETYINTNDWVASRQTGIVTTGVVYTGAGTNNATINTSLSGSPTIEILYYVRKSAGEVRTKTLVTTTGTFTPDGTGNINLGVADIFKVTKITLENSAGGNVASRYNVDNGQRDTHYAPGVLRLRPGQAAPGSDVYVEYQYFSHGSSGDFFAVNSYNDAIGYANIPIYNKDNGEVYDLRNYIDFRSVMNSSSTFAGGNARIHELPQTSDLISMDVNYYAAKAIKVVIDTSNNVTVVESEPAITPTMPISPSNSLDLFQVILNPYLINDRDLISKTISAKRFTMKDIAKLEQRLDHLEEVTALSLLEVDTKNLNVVDADGNNRSKSGFFVDNFADHYRSFTDASDFRASIDLGNKIMRPSFSEANIRLTKEENLSTGVVFKGDNVYLDYSETRWMNQPTSTEILNLNPFSVIINQGVLDLSPSSDEWTEVRYEPEKIVKGEGKMVAKSGSTWNGWSSNWTGRVDDLNGLKVGANVGSRGFQSGNFWITDTARVVSQETVRELIDDRILDVAFIPFMRSRKVSFRAWALKPNTKVFAFFDNVSVADWVRQEAFQRFSSTVADYGNKYNKATSHPDVSSALTTNSEGYVSGSFFIPSTNNIKFSTGEKQFKLLDISVPNDDGATSIAATSFKSAGVLQTRQATYLTTRITTVSASRASRRNRDPLAQTFLVEDAEGIFVTKIGIRFASKDSQIPVMLQIRPAVNGVPSADDIVPGGVKVLSPSAINIPAGIVISGSEPGIATVNGGDSGTVETFFEFEEPVYLQGNTEYSVVLLADSVKYKVFTAKSGDFVLGSTEKRVTKQPSLGSLFISQNSRVWTPDQTRDLTFSIHRAVFDITSGASLVMSNAELPVESLPIDSLYTYVGTRDVQVDLPNHGFQNGDLVNIAGSTDVGGILAANINGQRTITDVDGTGFIFSAGGGTNSTVSVFGGGDAVTSTRQYLMDVAIPMFQWMTPEATGLVVTGKFTTGMSFAGYETAYQKQSGYIPVTVSGNNTFNSPQLVATTENEIEQLSGDKSVYFNINLKSGSNKVSPVIDLQRASMTCINNLIDNGFAGPTPSAGFNIPLNYIAETQPSAGTALAKHLTQPVALEADAVGLKVLVACQRPSSSNFDLYYRTEQSDPNSESILLLSEWALATPVTSLPSDDDGTTYREYEYLIGGDGGTLAPFDQFQIKIVMRSTSSSRVPQFRDLRVIALRT
jgi:hypothetical protein